MLFTYMHIKLPILHKTGVKNDNGVHLGWVEQIKAIIFIAINQMFVGVYYHMPH